MIFCDLHTHTKYSDGKGSVEQSVQSAISKSLVSLGICDHSETRGDMPYCLTADRINDYLSEIRRVAERYKGQIEVYAGIELDALTQSIDREKFDYIIGDCHYIPTSGGDMPIDLSRESLEQLRDNYFGGDSILLAKRYYEYYTESIQKMKPDILGHIDLLTKFSTFDTEAPKYLSYATEALVACLEVTPIIELNTGAISRGYRAEPYPSVRLLREVLAHGGRVILSSDSHTPENIAYGFGDAVRLLRQIGFRSSVVLRGGELCEVGIESE